WFPDAEHRQCTRHIYANFKKKWSGLQFKRLFWKAAASSMNEQFLEVMEEIKALDENAYTWMKMLTLGWLIMTQTLGVEHTLKWIDLVLHLKMEFLRKTFRIHENQTKVVYASGFQKVEVRRQDEAFGVNIHLKKCACNMWELTGLRCVHAVAGYIHLKKDPELGVTEWFSKNKWFESYQYSIRPVPGTKLWKKSDLPKPLPPGERKLPGRPRKRRIRHPSEYDHEISRVGRVMHCHRCWQSGHNKSKCTNAPKPKPDNFYEIPIDEERKHGSNNIRERDQYQQAGPSVDEKHT
nr:hypothetical protein CTI12_AA105810 [Tanacetum cinerariifolium]